MENIHENLIQKIIFKHFGKNAEKIERMRVGLANEVYSVQVNGSDYIVRMNERESIKGSGKYIPLFKSLGIKIPELIIEDYSKELISYNYQILNKIKGVDIKKVIATLPEEQLQNIAKEIADIIKKLINVPTNGLFGYVGITEEKLEPSLNVVVEKMLNKIKERNAKTGVVKKEYIEIFEKILVKYEKYFRNVKSEFYFDDMSSKNVIIHNGKFNGIVDLDGVAYGDFLESIGRIKASWYGTKYGEYYTNAVMDSLNLNEEQRKIVIMWALLNVTWWQSELGIQFNQNSSINIDPKKVQRNNVRIDGLIKELSL